MSVNNKKEENVDSLHFTFIPQFIYQEFYKTTSAPEQGTLFQLRNVIHRVYISGRERAVDKFR